MKKQEINRKKTWEKALSSWFAEDFPSRTLGGVELAALPLLLLKILRKNPAGLVLVCPDRIAAERIQRDFSSACLAVGAEFRPLSLFEPPQEGSISPSEEGERSGTLFSLCRRSEPFCLFCTAGAFVRPLASPDDLFGETLELKPGLAMGPEEISSRLVELDYDDECEAGAVGEFSRRGGILDIFSPAHPNPARIEFWGDEIDTIRWFSALDQKSFARADSFFLIPKIVSSAPLNSAKSAFVPHYLSPGVAIAFLHPENCLVSIGRSNYPSGRDKSWQDALRFISEKGFSQYRLLDLIESDSEGVEEFCGIYPSIESRPETKGRGGEGLDDELERVLIAGRLRQWLDCSTSVFMLGKNESALEYASKWCVSHSIPSDKISFDLSELEHGFYIPSAKIAALTEKELFPSTAPSRFAPILPDAKRTASKFVELQFTELDEGDFVVHADYGIGIFRGIIESEDEGGLSEKFMIEFADDKMVMIPLYRADCFSRYVGAGKKTPRLSAIGGRRWHLSKMKAAVSVRGVAEQMIRVQAQRAHLPGVSFHRDDHAQYLFERAFPYDDTPDQKRVSEEIKRDMESPRPMDRLLCGDVGYGKTEVAARAAFKAVNSGFQVAMLVPTTLLAQQHLFTFAERFAETPVIIDMISRFRTPAEQKAILEKTAEGKLDILIGTHRIVQEDVVFKKLGLLIIDEEQRFGVETKERLKRLRSSVDVLTMTATPIPRTLYLSVTGIRDLSAISTPPELRLPIKTLVARYDKKLVSEAIMKEIERGGQTYYLHNHVASIREKCSELRALLPEARFSVAHGQMPEDELEDVMSDFLCGRSDVLVCTTIIQSGIDIPNANTIIVERADKFGLSELYQIRGRVGRWNRQAYAYLLIPEHVVLEGNARERMSAIKKYSQLGAGFRLALRDLEIRGSGNILGHEQSGHIDAVGFDLYCSFLKHAVSELKGEKKIPSHDITVSLDFLQFAHKASPGKIAAGISPDYIPFERLRIEFYRRLAKSESKDELDEIRDEMKDKFGKIPRETLVLLRFFAIMIALRREETLFIGSKGPDLKIKQVQRHGRRAETAMRFDSESPERKLNFLERHFGSHMPSS